MLYIFLILIAIASIIVGVYANKKCDESPEARKIWRPISILLGVAMIIIAGVLIFTMFR